MSQQKTRAYITNLRHIPSTWVRMAHFENFKHKYWKTSEISMLKKCKLKMCVFLVLCVFVQLFLSKFYNESYEYVGLLNGYLMAMCSNSTENTW